MSSVFLDNGPWLKQFGFPLTSNAPKQVQKLICSDPGFATKLNALQPLGIQAYNIIDSAIAELPPGKLQEAINHVASLKRAAQRETASMKRRRECSEVTSTSTFSSSSCEMVSSSPVKVALPLDIVNLVSAPPDPLTLPRKDTIVIDDGEVTCFECTKSSAELYQSQQANQRLENEKNELVKRLKEGSATYKDLHAKHQDLKAKEQRIDKELVALKNENVHLKEIDRRHTERIQAQQREIDFLKNRFRQLKSVLG